MKSRLSPHERYRRSWGISFEQIPRWKTCGKLLELVAFPVREKEVFNARSSCRGREVISF
ncbi:MAG: hypothetical protein WC389_07920, partial [Lutibacter sp.]